MIEEKRRGMRGDPDKEARIWLEKIADVDRQRVRVQDLAIEGLLSPEELRSKLSRLQRAPRGPREAATRELETLRSRREEAEELERDQSATATPCSRPTPGSCPGASTPSSPRTADGHTGASA